MAQRELIQSLVSLILLCSHVVSEGFYEEGSRVAALNQSNFKEEVLDSKQIWIVAFYATWCGHCRNMAPEYQNVARKLEGIVKVGAVDTDQEPELTSQYNIESFPTIMIFGDDKNAPGKYDGPKTEEAMVRKAKEMAHDPKTIGIADKTFADDPETEGKLPHEETRSGDLEQSSKSTGLKHHDSDVIALTDETFNETVIKSKDPWLVEFYAPWCAVCQRLAPKWEKIATTLKGKVNVGSYDADAGEVIGQVYKITGFPTIRFFPQGGKFEEDILEYEMTDTPEQDIIPWVNDRLKESMAAPNISQLVNQETFDSACTNVQLCIITVLPNILDCPSKCRNSLLETLSALADKYKKTQWGWLWTEAMAYPKVEEIFGLGGAGYPAMAALSTKKSGYATFKGSFDFGGINKFLQSLFMGGESTAPVKGTLPEISKSEVWDGQDGVAPQETDEDRNNTDSNPPEKDEL